MFELSTMSAKAHWCDKTVPFDPRNSEVAKWLMEQDWFWEWAMQKARDSGAIVFDPETSKWNGAQTETGRKVIAQKAV